jgi:hypothetical protein
MPQQDVTPAPTTATGDYYPDVQGGPPLLPIVENNLYKIKSMFLSFS